MGSASTTGFIKEQGKVDGVFITTTGVGIVPPGVDISGDRARPGDKVLVSGTLGDHGTAIMSQREGLSFSTSIASDSASRPATGWRRL